MYLDLHRLDLDVHSILQQGHEANLLVNFHFYRIREVRQRELILLIQSSQPASSKAKIWARAVGLLSMYLITTPYLASHGDKSVQCLHQRSTLPGGETQPTRMCSHMLQKREGLFYKGRRERIRKLPGGGKLYPLSRALPFSCNSVSLGEEKAFPKRYRHLCWGWQVWSSWSLRDTLKKGGQDTRY